MAKSNAVWGIDIGQTALKALRCRPGEVDDQIIADAFDYIEYPKILSQPDADAAELVREALELFLSRNTVRGDKVAISVSGQSGLARFIKLPPVESKKIPDIVKYEARQQIPFALEDVVWDYQQMEGGSVEDGFALETEVGLFAMKRDQVERALKPFEDAGIEVDIVQLTPLTIYNFTVFDQMSELPPPDQFDPENPPDSVVVISLGTDTTDLVVTNGYRVWQRSVPIGGSHFTKALTKELRLTFGKAEHLKKNAQQAEDPKAVYQAMRPVFNDLLTQIQRSINFFQSVDREANIGRVIALGNAMRLAGLQKYLSQNLGQNVAEVTGYRGLVGPAVVDAPQFKENLLSFAVCYGLALQGLNKSKLSTNLLPPELVTERLIRDKKPWAVAMVAALLLGLTINFLGHWRAWNSVHPTKFQQAISAADQATSEADQKKSAYEAAKGQFTSINDIGAGLVGNVEGRWLWPEMLMALSQCLPSDPPDARPEKIGERNELHITEMECENFPDLAAWYSSGVGEKITAMKAAMKMPAPIVAPAAAAADGATLPADGTADPSAAAAPGTPVADAAAAPVDPAAAPPDAGAAPADGSAPAEAPAETSPAGPGWVIQLRGFHFHNDDPVNRTSRYLYNTLIENLQHKVVTVIDPKGAKIEVPIKELGISSPVILTDNVQYTPVTLPDNDGNLTIRANRWDFVVQFAWSPTTYNERQEKKKQQATGEQPAELAAGGAQ
jgi:type IV pilus assembly protein PilM